MQVLKIPYRFSFMNNPMIVRLSVDAVVLQKIDVEFFGKTYHLSAYPTAQKIVEWEISDLFKADEIRIAYDGSNFMFINGEMIHYGSVTQARSYNIYYYNANGTRTLINTSTSYVFPGGISKSEIRRMNKENTDIFTERFQNEDVNFLFSTRTRSREIMLYREEADFFIYRAPVFTIASGTYLYLWSNLIVI